MEEKNVVSYFSGLSAKIESVKDFQKLYNPVMAFNFNAFNFFRPGENKISEILAFFLDPSQTHGQGDKFLELFLKNVNLNHKISLKDFIDVKCECEHRLPNQRRIDILITFDDDKYGIAIENKIWARDQKEQLKDYNIYLEEKFGKNYTLLYLTPYQNEPSNESIEIEIYNQLKEIGHLQIIGYTDEIIDCVNEWAMHCKADRVRVFLLDFEQYLKSEFFMEENKIIANYAIKSSENLEVAFGTFQALNEIKKQLLDLFKEQIKEIADANNLEYGISLEHEYPHFRFFNKSWKYINITFQFSSKSFNDLMLGIGINGESDRDEPISISAELKYSILQKFNASAAKGPWWIFDKNFDESFRHWNNNSLPWIEIQNKKMMKRIEISVKEFVGKIGDEEV
jgi:hypothetical protein